MRAEHWKRVSELFERALDIPKQARADWLADECAGDAELREAVERMLDADTFTDDFLERPLMDVGDHDISPAGADIAGTMFGPYRALQPIGAGGMGEVWLAARADGEFEQRVAIKRLHYPTPELVRRFRHERRVLAGLQHPNIAQLHDGGVGADGAPYFVMEYVEGEPITRYCEEHGCGLDARIGLLLQVCDAVQHAHRNLVVHRDLKPSNVLVDGASKVKLLAKVLESTDGSGEATATLVQRMTPDYAAPEQIRGEQVTTATDVYALGVLLFELLAGERPYRLGRQRGDIERAIVAVAPSSASSVAARSSGASREWARRLRGDLDRIIAKAMAKEPERRYASAEALAEDLRRHRAGHPVLARGDDASYRMSKFVGRNRAGVAAATAVIIALVAATAISLHQARVAQRQAQRADAEKSFVLGILDANDPNDTQGKGETLTARQILDRAAERLDKDLADQPAVRAQLKNEIGNLYWDYGQYARALPLFEQSVHLAQATDLPAAQRVAFMIDLGDDQRILRHLDDASATFRNAMSLARATDGIDSDLDLSVRSEYSVTLAYSAHFVEAEAEARQVLDAVAMRHPKDSSDYSDALGTLAFALGDHRRQTEVVSLLQRQLVLNERLHPEIHSAISTVCNDLGVALLSQGQLPQAESSLRRALVIHEKLLGKSHPHYGGTETNLARVLDREGHFEEALTMLADGLEIRRRALGDEADMLDGTYRALALNALHLGDAVVAETNARRALELDLRTYGAHHQNSVDSQMVLGSVLLDREKFDEAQPLLQAAATTADEIYGKPNDAGGYARALQARTLARGGHVDAAMLMFGEARVQLHASVGDQHFETADALTWQGEAELVRGDIQRADETAQQAVTAARASYPAGDALIADSLFLQARVDLAFDRSADALPLLREALALRKSALKVDDPRIAEIERALPGSRAGLPRATAIARGNG
ncbi:MAG: serine/threonine-protein kinase [Dokdonella sp.]